MCEKQRLNSLQIEREEREIEKLDLEIKDLKKRFFKKWNFYTIIISLITAGVVFYSVYAPLKKDIERKTDERLFDRYAPLLSSKNKAQRERAAIGLKDIKDIVEKLKIEYSNARNNSILRAGILEAMREYDFDKKEIKKFAWDVLKNDNDINVKFCALKTIENISCYDLLQNFYTMEESEIKKIQTNFEKKHKIPKNMAYIPSGSFIIGTDNGDLDEAPYHVKEIKHDYYIDKYEVTNKDFIKEYPDHKPDSFSNCDECPVARVTWEQAKSYCDRLGKRLPTEAEWEKAARGIYGRKFAWGFKEDSSFANSKNAGKGKATPVSAFPKDKSPYGVYNMSGNVREWTQSYYLRYSGSKYRAFAYGKDKRVIRGGSFWDPLWGCRTTTREYYFPKNFDIDIGFRCVKDIQ